MNNLEEKIIEEFRELYKDFPIDTKGVYEQRIKGIEKYLLKAIKQVRAESYQEVIEIAKDVTLEHFEVLDGRDNTQAEFEAMEITDEIEKQLAKFRDGKEKRG